MDANLIMKITKASGVSPGELVLVHFWGEDGEKSIANEFVTAVAALGASPVLLQQARSLNQKLFLHAAESSFDMRYFEIFSKFDVVLDVFAYQPITLGKKIDEEKMVLYRKYISGIFDALIKSKRFVQIRVPTQENGMESGLDPQEYIRRMTAAYDIDYDALRCRCLQEVEKYKGKNRVCIRTGTDCQLNLELFGRKWHVDAGTGDFPCGEIYIAPIEGKTDGKISFEKLHLAGVKYENVTLLIREGVICGSNCREVDLYFANQPRENKVICEFGLGMNDHIGELCGYSLLDETMAGTFHIAVGANTMFGGENSASVHMDFVGRGKVEITE